MLQPLRHAQQLLLQIQDGRFMVLQHRTHSHPSSSHLQNSCHSYSSPSLPVLEMSPSRRLLQRAQTARPRQHLRKGSTHAARNGKTSEVLNFTGHETQGLNHPETQGRRHCWSWRDVLNDWCKSFLRQPWCDAHSNWHKSSERRCKRDVLNDCRKNNVGRCWCGLDVLLQRWNRNRLRVALRHLRWCGITTVSLQLERGWLVVWLFGCLVVWLFV